MKRRFLVVSLVAFCTLSLSACGKNADDYNEQGKAYFNENDYIKAEEAFTAAIAKDGENAEYYLNLGKTLLELGEYEDAKTAFSSVLTYEPQNREAYWGIGMVYYYSGNYSAAVKNFESIIKASGENYDKITLESLQYYAALQTYYENYAVALDSYELLIKNDYNVAQQNFFMGNIYIGQEMENEAVLAYEKALEAYGSDYEIYYNIYTNFMEGGYTDRAYSYLKRGIDLPGVDNLLKGKSYYILGDYQNAKTYLAKASDEGKAEADYFLAMTYDKLGNYAEAESLYEGYIKNYPSDYEAYNEYGMYYYNKGVYDKALSLFSQGIALARDNVVPELLFNEACCYEALHDFSTAYEKFRAYLEMFPDDEAARHEFVFLSTR